jgi:trimethylamine--corrinoid protein Co-methyltransferase
MGATLAVLAGINNISGPGMLDFESCQSLQKLVLDNEICGMTQRMARGIEPKEDFPSIPLFQELLKEKHLLISKHTRKYIREEHHFSGKIINRANLSRWEEEGSLSLTDRANQEIERLLNDYQPSRLPEDIKKELTLRMEDEARLYGMDKLPE